MSGLKNIFVICHLFESFPDKFVMYGVTIKSSIESPMLSPTILNSSGSIEYRINPTEGTYTLLKPTIYPGSNDLVQQHASAMAVLFDC
jgi:hypothetical protein